MTASKFDPDPIQQFLKYNWYLVLAKAEKVNLGEFSMGGHKFWTFRDDIHDGPEGWDRVDGTRWVYHVTDTGGFAFYKDEWMVRNED